MLNQSSGTAENTGKGNRGRVRRRPRKGFTVTRVVAVLLGLVSIAAFATATANAGVNFLPKKIALETNEKYGKDCFWAPPKGMDYAKLPGAIPIQNPNLFPDVGSTYFVAQYKLPEGASLTFHGKFGYQRYMSWTIFGRPGQLGQIGAGDQIRDFRIKPDKGSINPFRPGANRMGGPRKYTLHIVSGDIPAKPATNTLYTETTDPDTRLGMSIRNYIPDKGRDGTGDAGLPKLVLNLADGTKLRGQAACAMLDPIEDVSKSTFPAPVWKGLVAASPDPENAPATNPPTWEKFWNALYNVAGIFIEDEAERQATYPPTQSGGFQNNPDTSYLLTPVSLRYGPLITFSGKMPTYPKTLPAAKKWTPKDYQVRYWSLCAGSSPVSFRARLRLRVRPAGAALQGPPIHPGRRYAEGPAAERPSRMRLPLDQLRSRRELRRPGGKRLGRHHVHAVHGC